MMGVPAMNVLNSLEKIVSILETLSTPIYMNEEKRLVAAKP